MPERLNIDTEETSDDDLMCIKLELGFGLMIKCFSWSSTSELSTT